MAQIPQALRGKYNRIGWTANGIQPWGLQSDPIGADGYLFSAPGFSCCWRPTSTSRATTSGRGPSKTGCHDETYELDMHRIAERLESQYRAHPEGPHCENTRILEIRSTGLPLKYGNVSGSGAASVNGCSCRAPLRGARTASSAPFDPSPARFCSRRLNCPTPNTRCRPLGGNADGRTAPRRPMRSCLSRSRCRTPPPPSRRAGCLRK